MTNNYFYGIDYLKMKLYCKIKSIKSYYELQKYLKVKFDWQQSYEVLIDYRADFIAEFEVLNVANDELIRIKVNYHFIDFFYFFENMEEQEKVYLNDCIR